MNIDDLLVRARASLRRVDAHETQRALANGALVVDIRPIEQRARDGHIPGAVVIDRNVLEWRLDPASPNRIANAPAYDQQLIVVCNEGYASSLAAATLQELGLARATDLDGGFQAWAAAGLPVAHDTSA
jgi:rhodanese-related sulfurtransferase